MRYTRVILIAILLAGCEEQDFVIHTRDVSLPAVADLRVHQSVRLTDGTTVTFERVAGDSRCPIGAYCYWEGDAATELTVRRPISSAVDCTLHTTLEPKFVIIDGLRITLRSLAPYPQVFKPIDPTAYIATLDIVRLER